MGYKIFVDADVIIDFFTDRPPHTDFANRIFKLNAERKVEIFISAACITNVYYIVRKFLGHKKTLEMIAYLPKMCEIIGTTKEEILEALKNDFTDFEDSIQYSSALNVENLTAIVTRNVKDYKNSEIPVLTSQDFLNFFDKTH